MSRISKQKRNKIWNINLLRIPRFTTRISKCPYLRKLRGILEYSIRDVKSRKMLISLIPCGYLIRRVKCVEYTLLGPKLGDVSRIRYSGGDLLPFKRRLRHYTTTLLLTYTKLPGDVRPNGNEQDVSITRV